MFLLSYVSTSYGAFFVHTKQNCELTFISVIIKTNKAVWQSAKKIGQPHTAAYAVLQLDEVIGTGYGCRRSKV